MSVKIILIRHGETYLSLKKVYYGRIDTPLTAKGLRQAKDIRKYFSRENVDKVYSSNLKRAFNFAKIAFDGFIIEKTSELREINFGVFERLTHEQIMKKYRQAYSRWLKDPFTCVIPQGDSLSDFSNRVRAFFKKIIRENSNKTLAIVTHAGPIRIILNDIIRPENIWSLKVDLASVSVIEYKKNKADLQFFNDRSYLT